MTQLSVKLPDELKCLFSSDEFVELKRNDRAAVSAALLWLWCKGDGVWVSRHPKRAADALDDVFAMYPKLPRSRIKFVTPKDLAFLECDYAVLDDPASMNGSIAWASESVKHAYRCLEPTVSDRSATVISAPLDAQLGMLEDARNGEPCEYDELELVRSVTCKSLYHFMLEFWSTVVSEKFVDNWHVQYLCDEMQAVMERVFRNEPKEYDLVINVPPGSTKSMIASVMLPAWCWARMPSFRFIGGSYAFPLAMDLSRRTRQVVKSSKYQRCFPTKLKDDQDAKAFFMNESGGMRMGVGTGGIAGFHGHVIVPDDPMDPNKAASEKALQAADDWIKNSLSQRKVDQDVTPMVTIMQRVHEQDPSGVALSRDSDGSTTKHICIPAELTEDVRPRELTGRYVDGLMDPMRLNRRVLDEKKKLGVYLYSGQYLQSPTPPEGGMFKIDKLAFVKQLPETVRVVRSWDYAGTEDDGCYSAGVKMALLKDGRVCVAHVTRGQWSTGQRDANVKRTAEYDGANAVVLIEQEPGSSGLSVVNDAKRRLGGFHVKGVKPTGDKVWRADPFAGAVDAGEVLVLVAPWNVEFVDELKHFPKSKFKDQVDAAAQAYNHLTKRGVTVKGGW